MWYETLVGIILGIQFVGAIFALMALAMYYEWGKLPEPNR